MKKTRLTKLIAAIMVLTLGTALLAGCGKSGESSTNASSGQTKDNLVVVTAYDAKALDPQVVNDVASSNVMNQVYETLVALNDKNEVIPKLAEFKKVDDLTYEFKLKQGVKFHNGEELKASDVKFTFERGLSPIAAPNSHVFGDVDPNGIKVIDDYTIQLKTKQPVSGFLGGLTTMGSAILNEKAVKEAGDNYSMNPVGTGPFKFVSWTKGDRVELTRFDDYYGNKPKIKNITIRAIPEPTNRTIELESGAADIAYEISANDLSRVKDNKDLKIMRVLDNSTAYLGFNTSKKPFDNVKVRQAISYALDMPTIIQTVWRGIGAPTGTFIPPNIKYSNPDAKVHEYNVEKAKQLMAEAGYANGFKTTIWTNEKKERIDMATIMQSQLKEINVDVEIKVMEWGAYLESTAKGEHEMYILGWTTMTPDPDLSVYSMFHSSKFGNGGNRTFYKNAELDDLIIKGRTMEDSDERKAVYYRINDILKEDAPWVLLHNGEQVVGVNKNVQGFAPSPVGYHVLYNVYFGDK